MMTPKKGKVEPRNSFAEDVLMGLTRTPKKISSRYFYDKTGSEIFQEIMKLDEYYLTRYEQEVLHLCASEITKHLYNSFRLTELGAGDAEKTVTLIRALIEAKREFNYYPIDISEKAQQQCIENIPASVKCNFIVADNLVGLQKLKTLAPQQTLVLFLGSSIGNYTPLEAVEFLRAVNNELQPNDLLLIGFDLVKDVNVMQKAYDDSQGITARFNLNLLRRINKELDGYFELGNFAHKAWFDKECQAMRSGLISTCKQRVPIGAFGRTFGFEKNELLHTEMSCKYTLASIADLAQQSGWVLRENFEHPKKDMFCDSLWIKP
ncbi:MAG: L-histidine N(alpha)-methyltransferase [bacterium]|nr:L-histidine N(alpha)-methyltransferase [bacterium]